MKVFEITVDKRSYHIPALDSPSEYPYIFFAILNV